MHMLGMGDVSYATVARAASYANLLQPLSWLGGHVGDSRATEVFIHRAVSGGASALDTWAFVYLFTHPTLRSGA